MCLPAPTCHYRSAMASRRDPRNVAERAAAKLQAVCSELANIRDDIGPEEWLLLRARIGKLLAGFNNELGVLDESFGMTSAQDRIIRYLQLRRGEVVTKDEISGVAGISAWARRVRELREDHGWVIHTVHTMPRLGPGQYVLATDKCDPGLARAWLLAREKAKLKARGGRVPAKARVLEFLKAVHPRPADPALLAHVAASAAEATRAIDELERDGWSIVRLSLDDPVNPGGISLGNLDSLNS